MTTLRSVPTGPDVTPPTTRDRTGYALLLSLVVGLNLFGLVMVLSASSVQGAQEGSTWGYFTRQLIWLGLGCVALLVMLRIDYRRWRPLAPFLYGTSLALLVIVLLPGIGVEVNGAQRWIQVGPQRFQPSELAKLGVLLMSASVLAARQKVIRDHRRSLNPVLLLFAPVAGLVLLEPDLGTTIIIGTVVASLLVAAGVPMKPLVKVGGLGAAAALVLAVSADYRRARLLGFIDPWADPQGQTYQSLQSLIGLASGGVDGVGLGESRAKWGFLPNAHTDFIYAVVGEELGLIGTLTVLSLFVMLGLLGYRAALGAPDAFGTLVATGVTTWLLVQAFVNMGGVVGLLPITGVTLPFVSFGGTSLIVNMAAAGLLLNISRQARR
ncbi:MAG: putative lipid II flippase FtsW [Actinomycetota bacterium]